VNFLELLRLEINNKPSQEEDVFIKWSILDGTRAVPHSPDMSGGTTSEGFFALLVCDN